MNLEAKNKYLETHVFYGLRNQNNGFDAKSIKHFSKSDFKIVLERIEKIGIEIYGIETWKNDTFFDVLSFEDYNTKAADPNWYWKAFQHFVDMNKDLHYSASYNI